MEKYLDRVPVGSEKTTPHASVCPECLRSDGETHHFGCANEECPECRRFLIGCHCNCLSPADSEKIIKALYDRFTDMTAAAVVAAAADARPDGSASYLTHAAMRYLYENMTFEVRADLRRSFQESHPDLVPLLQDEAGLAYYTAEQLSLALQIPLARVHEKIEAMVAAGQGIRFGDGIHLKKVN